METNHFNPLPAPPPENDNDIDFRLHKEKTADEWYDMALMRGLFDTTG